MRLASEVIAVWFVKEKKTDGKIKMDDEMDKTTN